jgi:uncharacterized protein DUF5367
MFMINRRLLLSGLAIWLVATAVLRVGGQFVLRSAQPRSILVLFAVSFPLMALVARRLCRASHLPRADWPAGAVSLALPTLLLDPFSSAFFPAIFPNISPALAGVFGGWMLWCCAGALAGVMITGSDRDHAPQPARR